MTIASIILKSVDTILFLKHTVIQCNVQKVKLCIIVLFNIH